MAWLNRVNTVVTKVLEVAAALVFLAMFVLVAVLVIQRYVFATGLFGGDELLEYLFIYTSTIGAAVVLARREHVSIPVFWGRMRPWVRKAFDTLNHLVIMVLNGYMLVLSHKWIAGVGGSPSTMLRIPMWIVEIALPIGCGLTLVYGLLNILGSSPRKDEAERGCA